MANFHRISPLGGPPDSSSKSGSMGADTDRETEDSTCLSNCASDSAAVGCRGEAAGEALPAGVRVACDSSGCTERLRQASKTTMAQTAAKTPTNNTRPNILRGFMRFAEHPE
jgi:hypothetical protein